MKIILREHVEHLGDRGDEVNVAAGYARNYLLPKGLAYPAGAGSAKQIEDQKRAWAVRETRSEDAAKALASRIGKLELSARRRAGDGGTLYGSVTNSDIAEMMAEAGHKIERRKIQLKEAIKSLGDYEVAVKLHRSIAATLKVSVLTEAGKTLAEVEAARAELEPAPAEDERPRQEASAEAGDNAESKREAAEDAPMEDEPNEGQEG